MDSITKIKRSLQSMPALVFLESPEHSNHLQTVRWVKVVSFPDKYLNLGLSVNGTWVREGLDDVCVLCPNRGLVPLYPCLELEPNLVRETLAKALADLGLPPDFVETLPISDLVEQALKSGSEHWTKLGLQWVDSIAKTKRIEEALVLVSESKDKRLSQRTRQDAKLILKTIGKSNYKCDNQ